MKKLLLILVVQACIYQANSKNYYVSSSEGVDTNNGLSSSTAWNSINKVNSMMSVFTIGDSILFKCGDTFTETLNISKSGSSSMPIVFASYGVGSKPVINTSVAATGWIATAANPLIWEADYTGTLTDFRYLTINDQIQQIGRYPDTDAANDGFLYSDQVWGSNKLRDAALNAATRDWTGAVCVVYATPYSINVCPIQSHVKDTLILGTNTAYGMYAGYGYFIQGHLATLTKQGEWYFNPATKKIYLYSNINPNTLNVRASAASKSILFSTSVSGIVVKNFSFRQSNGSAVEMTSANYITIANCDFQYAYNGINCMTSYNITLNNNKFYDIFNTSIASTAMSSNFVVSNNLIKRNALRPGFAGNGSSVGNNAISVYCTNANVSYNTIDSCSYTGIRYEGYGNKVHHNEVSNFNMKQFDGGGIYSYGTWSSVSGLGNVYGNNVIEYNYIHDGIGYLTCSNAGDGFNRRPGIYCDNLSEQNTVRRNILYNTNGILLNNNTHHHTVVENTIYNSEAFENQHPGIAGIGGYYAGAFHTVSRNTLFNVTNKIDFNPYTSYTVGRSVITVAPFTNHGHRNTQNIVFSSKYYRHLPVSADNAFRNYPQYFNKVDSNYYWQPFALDTMVTMLNDSGFTKTRKMVYGPVQWKQYEPNAVFKTCEVPFTYGTPEANLFASNSTFNSDLSGWSFDSENTTDPCYWYSGVLDGGSVILSQVNTTSATKPSSVRLYRSIGNVKEGDVYLLKFSMKSTTNSATLHINTTSSMSTPKMYKTSTTRTEYSVPICFSDDATSQYIYFTFHDKGKLVFLDNISLQKVSITQESPATAMRFEVNPTNAAKQIDLGAVNYADVFGKIYSGTITMEPYTSKILLKTTQPSAVRLTYNDAAACKMAVYPVPNKAGQPLHIALSGSSSSKGNLRIFSISGSPVFISSVVLIAGKSELFLPKLASGIYFIEMTLDDGTKLCQRFIQ